MRIIFLLLTLLLSAFVYSQIGIETETPQTSLDINGSIQLRNDLKLNGNDTTIGNPGVFGQVVASEGAGESAVWKNVNVPFLENEQYQLINSFSKIDMIGISFPTGSGDGNSTNNINDSLDSSWSILDDLTTEINVNNADNKVSLTFQSGVELSKISSNNQNIKYICGAFFNDKIKAMRPNQIDAISGKEKNQSLISLSYTVLNLEEGTHTVKIGCRKIATTNNNLRLSIGRPSEGDGNTQTNNFTMQSILKLDVIEKVTFPLN